MGWFIKIKSFSIYMIAFTILFGSLVESLNTDCNLFTSKDPIQVESGTSFVNLNVLNLNVNNRTYSSCVWNVTQPVGNTFFELSRVVLAANDKLTVVGFHSDSGKITNETLYQGNGSVLSGLISTSACSYITVTLELSKDNATRTYSTVYYWNSDLLQLGKDSGSLSFPINMNKGSKINNQFNLQPDNEFSDRVIMLNFTQLPENAAFTLDGIKYDSKTPPPAIYFQKNGTPLKFVLSDYSAAPILFSYSLVSADCSGIVNLKADGSQSIALPNEAYRKQQLITSIKCAQYFIAPEKTQFQLLLDPNLKGLVNPGDSVNVYSKDGNLELGLNAPAIMYFRTIENFLSGNQFLVVYDSPYSSNSNTNITAPVMKVIPEDQAKTITLSADLPVTVKGTDKNSKVVHVIYPQDLSSDAKHVLVDFSGASISAGQLSISIYNVNAESAQPITVLGQFDHLPRVISTNAPFARVVYSGTFSLNVTYRLVEANSSCQLVSTTSPNFEVRGGQSSSACSWYIPQNLKKKNIVINPTIVKIPQGKTLTVNVFNETGLHTLNFNGPINEFYIPDVFLNSSSAYEFILDSANVSKDDLHLLIAEKKNYLNESIWVQSTEKLSTVKSPNYPGYYPIGVTENWLFNGTSQNWALVSIEDVHLAGGHHLDLVSAESRTNLSGDADLTNVPDYLVHYPFSLNLDSRNVNFTSPSNRGFRVGLQYPGVAEDISVKDSHVINFASVNASSNPLNIWKVTASGSSTLQSDSILLINVTLADGLDKTKAKLSIYDSISLRPQSVHYANGSLSGTTGFFVGSIKSAFIVYNYADSIATKANFSISITVTAQACSNTKNYTTKCQHTDRCITDMMICNGIDECGDYTDELFCKGNRPPPPPTPTPSSGGGGVNTLVVLFILMPLSAILGIVGYIYMPQFLHRIRRGRYSEFRDLSEVS